MWELLLTAALAFPAIDARDLNGRAVHPRDLRGAPAVFALGFSYGARRQVEPWTRALVKDAQGLKVIVMPVYKGVPGPVRGFVDGAMANATPTALRSYVWTTTDFDELARGLGLDAPGDDAAMVLVDGAGMVRHVARGAPTPAAIRALVDAWRALPGARS